VYGKTTLREKNLISKTISSVAQREPPHVVMSNGFSVYCNDKI
jgi:hypothetical protein